MKIKNKFIKYSILVFVIIAISFFCEIFIFNRNVYKYNNSYNPKIIETKDIKKINNVYKTTSDESYIVVEVDEDNNYIGNLEFEYKTDDIFEWQIILDDGNKILNKSSDLINIVSRNLNTNSKKVKIEFGEKDIEINNITINNKISFNASRIIFIIVSLLVIIFLIIFKDYFYKNLHNAFLVISLTIGLLLLLTTPKIIGASLDDNTHLKNSISFFNSESFTTKRGYLIAESSKSVSSTLFTSRKEQKAVYKVIDKSNDNVTLQLNFYSPKYAKLIYLPFKIGFIIGNIFNLPFTFCCFIARLINLIAYIVLFYFAIKLSTYAKRTIFVIGLSTSSLFLASQFSYDPTITASLILAFALYLRMLEEDKINYKCLLGFVFCVIWGSLPKAIYAFMLLLILFIPNKKFENNKTARIIKTVIILLTLLMISTFVLPVISGGNSGDMRGGNVNASEQLKYIFKNPLLYAKMLINFNITNFMDCQFLLGLFMFICNLQNYISARANCMFVVYSILVLYTVFTTKISKNSLSSYHKFIICVMLIGFFAIIPTTMYLAYSEVGSATIGGVQTRYYIPLLLPILSLSFPTYGKKQKIEYPIYDKIILFIPLLINLYVVYSLISYGIGI